MAVSAIKEIKKLKKVGSTDDIFSTVSLNPVELLKPIWASFKKKSTRNQKKGIVSQIS